MDWYSAVCGVAVRAGGDLFVYDNCRGESEGRVRLYECDDQLLKVQQLAGTATYKVTKNTLVNVALSQHIYGTLI